MTPLQKVRVTSLTLSNEDVMKGYLLLCLIKRLWYRVASHPLEVTQPLWCGKAVPNTGGASCLPLNFKVVNVISRHQYIPFAMLGIEPWIFRYARQAFYQLSHNPSLSLSFPLSNVGFFLFVPHMENTSRHHSRHGCHVQSL